MRTTVRLDPEVAAAAEDRPFRQRTASVGLKVDVTGIPDTLELLDETRPRHPRQGSPPTDSG